MEVEGVPPGKLQDHAVGPPVEASKKLTFDPWHTTVGMALKFAVGTWAVRAALDPMAKSSKKRLSIGVEFKGSKIGKNGETVQGKLVDENAEPEARDRGFIWLKSHHYIRSNHTQLFQAKKGFNILREVRCRKKVNPCYVR